MALSYLNFDLLIDRVGDRRYRANVVTSPGGEGASDFDLPFEGEVLKTFVVDVVPQTARGKAPATVDPAAPSVKEFGSTLFGAVFTGSVRDCLVTSLSKAREQKVALRLRLRLGTDSGLVNLPWECMYDPVSKTFLGLRDATSVVRYVALPFPPEPLTVTPPLRILMMVASPRGYPALDADRELVNLHTALKELIDQGKLVLDRLASPTLAALQARLESEEYHIFHFIGHGEFDEHEQRGLLVLEDGAGSPDLVPAESMGTLLPNDSLRLVILNSCEGGRASESDPFAGTAQTLIRADIPAVIAMQFTITDEAAIAFSRKFYTTIAAGRPVDTAVFEARRTIKTQVNDVEWATPVLYMRSDDGRIFDVQARGDEPPLPPPPIDEPDPIVEVIKPAPPPPKRTPAPVRPAVAVAAALERVTSDPHGPQRFRLILDNAGREKTEVHVSIEDPDEALILDLAEDTVLLPPGQEAAVEVVVRPRGRAWSAQPREHSFSVVIEPEGDAPKVVRGVVVRPPAITRVRLLFAALVGVAIVAVLGFVLIRPHPVRSGGGWVRTDLPGSVAYVSDAGITVYTPGSGKNQRILGIPGIASDPALSLDGMVLAFTVLAENGTSSIYTVQLPNGKPKQVTFPIGASDIDPALNRDGTQVAFVRGAPHAWRLFIRDLTGLDAARPLDDGNDARPAWSPDSTTIVFHRSTASEGAGLYVISLDGGTSGWLTTDPTDQSPAWSKTGPIVYHTNPGGRCCVLVTVDPATKATHDLGLDGAEPAWSPDGKYVVFHHRSWLMVAFADGSHSKKLLDAGTANPDPAW